MILFEETRPATPQDVNWLRQNLGRRLEDSCLGTIDPKLGPTSLPVPLIESVLAAVNDIASFIVERTEPKPTSLSLEVQIAGQRLRVEFRMDGGGFKDADQAVEIAGRVARSAGQNRLFSEGLEDIEYYQGSPNRLIGWRRLRKSQRRVLIVAKDAEERASLRSMLRQNYETSSAATAAEAQKVLESESIDAIVASYDCSYRQEGLFKAQFDESPVPVILLGWPNEFAEFRRQPFYIDQCLQKPVSTFALITAIETAISSYTRRLIHIANFFGKSAGVLLAGDLPHEFPGLKLEALSGTASYGGGDFALALQGKNYTRLILADIMGHGLKAKAGAIALSSIIRTLHPHAGSVGALLQSISLTLASQPAFAGIISTIIAADIKADGTAETASAGHPPAAIISPEQTFVLPVSGPIPGLLPNPVYKTVTHKLRPGERIAIVTDGIDSQSAATGVFPARLLKQLAKSQDLPIELLKGGMEKWLARKLGPAPKDDWTLLIAEYTGLSAGQNRSVRKPGVPGAGMHGKGVKPEAAAATRR